MTGSSTKTEVSVETEVTYEDPRQTGRVRRGVHHAVKAFTQQELDEKMSKLMALPGYKTWRNSPRLYEEKDFETGEIHREYRVRVIVWEGPEAELALGKKAEWPILKY